MDNNELIIQMLTNINTNISSMNDNISFLQSDVKKIKRDIKKLQKSDDLILDEIERVHAIFNQKYNELNAKIL